MAKKTTRRPRSPTDRRVALPESDRREARVPRSPRVRRRQFLMTALVVVIALVLVFEGLAIFVFRR